MSEGNRAQSGGAASFFWGGEERTQQGEHSYQAYIKTTYNCGACGVNLPEGAKLATRIRCARGHLNDIVKVGTHIKP